MKRVVVTGVGLITPLGTAFETFSKLCSSEIGIRELAGPGFEAFEDLPVKVAGLPLGPCSTVQSLALECASQAYQDSKLSVSTPSATVGVIFGTDKSSFPYLQRIESLISSHSYTQLDPLFRQKYSVSSLISEICSTLHISGYSSSISCGFATGQLSVIQAYKAIRHRQAAIILAGSSEDSIDASILMSLYKSGYLSREGEADSCKPFDIARDGFIYSSGAGCLVLEELDHALNRGANIYCEVTDTCLITEHKNESIEKSIKDCLRRVTKDVKGELGIVNCDAAGYKMFDEWEALAVEEICKENWVTSHKGNLGHMISAAGSVQSVISCLMVKKGIVPPVANLVIPTVEDVNYVCREAVIGEFGYAVSNSYSYESGVLSSILFKKFKE